MTFCLICLTMGTFQSLTGSKVSFFGYQIKQIGLLLHSELKKVICPCGADSGGPAVVQTSCKM